jgi:hypothetical protein
MNPSSSIGYTEPMNGRQPSTEYLRALAALGMAKLAFLLLDSTPHFFLWDSVTYLQGALGGELPRDRSFLYSFLIRVFAVWPHSLLVFVIAQTLAGLATAFLTFLILRRFASLPFAVALAGALLVAIEPSQIFYERMMMAEAFGGVLWLGFVVLALAYMRDGRWFWIPALALCGILTIAFRLNETMVILLISTCLPLLRALWTRRGPRSRQPMVAMHCALALACTVVLHTGYRHIVAAVAHTAPGYIGTEGLFRMGFLSPLVRGEDLRNTGCAEDLLQRVTRPFDVVHRNEQLWSKGGLWDVMQRECQEPERAANRVAARAAPRLARNLLPFALETNALYFDAQAAHWRMESDLGQTDPLPLELIDPVRAQFGFDVKPVTYVDTLSSSWFRYSQWWLTACLLLSPLLAAFLLTARWPEEQLPAIRLLAAILVGIFLNHFLFSPIISYRYAHPFPPLVIVGVLSLLFHARRPVADPGSNPPQRQALRAEVANAQAE